MLMIRPILRKERPAVIGGLLLAPLRAEKRPIARKTSRQAVTTPTTIFTIGTEPVPKI